MPLIKLLATLLLATLVTACGGGGGGGGDTTPAASSGTGSSGSVSGGTGSGSSGSGSGATGGSTGGSAPSTPPPPQVVSRTITLAWTPPSTRQDGTPLALSELRGYEIYYYREGTTSGDTVLPINGGSTQSTQLTLSTAGTYRFAIVAIDTSNRVSSLSNYVSVSVN
jgi:hypothetical protein